MIRTPATSYPAFPAHPAIRGIFRRVRAGVRRVPIKGCREAVVPVVPSIRDTA